MLLIVRLLNVEELLPHRFCNELPFRFTVPPLWEKVPLFVKSPVKFMVTDVEVSVPALMVSPPNVAVLLPRLKIPAPVLVRFWPPVMPAPSVILPVVPILLALPKVIAPLYPAGVPDPLNSAPPLEIPVPFNVNGSAVDNVIPFKSSEAPLVTEVAPADVPRAETLPSISVPALMLVAPV